MHYQGLTMAWHASMAHRYVWLWLWHIPLLLYQILYLIWLTLAQRSPQRTQTCSSQIETTLHYHLCTWWSWTSWLLHNKRSHHTWGLTSGPHIYSELQWDSVKFYLAERPISTYKHISQNRKNTQKIPLIWGFQIWSNHVTSFLSL